MSKKKQMKMIMITRESFILFFGCNIMLHGSDDFGLFPLFSLRSHPFLHF